MEKPMLGRESYQLLICCLIALMLATLPMSVILVPAGGGPAHQSGLPSSTLA